jgi:hypothetical protein
LESVTKSAVQRFVLRCNLRLDVDPIEPRIRILIMRCWPQVFVSAVSLFVSTAAFSSPADAAIYDAVSAFTVPSPASPWSYGSGVGGTSFTQLPNSYSNCYGVSGFSCYGNDPVSNPGIGSNTTASSVSFSTVNIPNSLLWLHPGPSSDVALRFTTPDTAFYSLSGQFERLDASGRGDGVVVDIYENASLSFQSNSLAGNSLAYGSSAVFDIITLLNAGDTVDFVVNNNGSYFFDSSGITATIATVTIDEPNSAAIFGASLAGYGLLRRRRAS